MTPTIERRIAALEEENAARKASYPVAGSLVRFTGVKSQVFERPIGSNQTVIVRIRFQADNPDRSGRSLVTLYPNVYVDGLTVRWPRIFYMNEPQTGDGSVVLRIEIATTFWESTYNIIVTATGSSGGVFTLL